VADLQGTRACKSRASAKAQCCASEPHELSDHAGLAAPTIEDAQMAEANEIISDIGQPVKPSRVSRRGAEAEQRTRSVHSAGTAAVRPSPAGAGYSDYNESCRRRVRLPWQSRQYAKK
jgi:hypothetical protein